ncbi:MAG: PKD domain-containing protein, partial [Bacteroidota bacterium]
ILPNEDGVMLTENEVIWYTNTGIPITENPLNPNDGYLPNNVADNVAGTYEYIVRQVSTLGCLGEPTSLIIRVASPPIPDFYFLEGRVNEAMPFVNLARSGDPSPNSEIVEWTWDFGNGNPPLTISKAPGDPDPTIDRSVTYDTPGVYDVILTVSTAGGCPESIIKKVVVYSVATFNEGRYQEDFEVDAGGWVSSTQTNNGNNPDPEEALDQDAIYGGKSSWGTAPRAYADQDEQVEVQAWITDNGSNTYNDNERSWVESPCFRFTNIPQPFISLRLRYDTNLEDDGAMLLYSRYEMQNVNPDETGSDNMQEVIVWEPVGDLSAGIDWYNSDGVSGIPITIDDDRKGWSGKSEGWVEARFDLSEIIAENEANGKDTRFRLYFGSNADFSDEPGEGIIFDAVEVGNKNRTVLIEHFSNLNDPTYQDPDLESFLDLTRDNQEYTEIRYHTTLPLRDAISMQNQPDNSGRQLHYKVANPPQAVIDGSQLDVNGTPFTTWGPPAVAVYNRRSLVGSPFNIQIAVPTGGTPLTVETTVTRNDAPSAVEEAILVHIAIVEKEVAYQGATLRNVVAKMLPHAAGTRFDQAWEEGQQATVTQTWQPDRAGDFAVIVFVANEVTKEIYQSAYQDIGALAGGRLVEGRAARAEEIQLYPNPTEQRFSVALPAALTQAQDWTVYDVLGTPLIRGTWPLNTWEVDIDASRLAEGTYIFQMGEVKKFFVVMR